MAKNLRRLGVTLLAQLLRLLGGRPARAGWSRSTRDPLDLTSK